jgi:hypothetical protein
MKTSKLKITKLGASPELDYLIAIKIMKFQPHQWHKGGSCPSDAKIINPNDAWSARGEGGTYPYILSGSNTMFRVPHAFGLTWAPSKLIEQAWEIVELFRTKKTLKFRVQDMGTFWRAALRGEPTPFYNDREKYYATGETAAEAICRCAMKTVQQ